jgi:hypothetical protein|tara:strand:- start:791 stop:1342 length:552 start_codon:yes stop_codon:yes gene_type:complete
MTKDESALKPKDVEYAVDEMNKVLLEGCEDTIGKDDFKTMIEELKEAGEEIDKDDVFTARTAKVLNVLGFTKFNVKKEKGERMTKKKGKNGRVKETNSKKEEKKPAKKKVKREKGKTRVQAMHEVLKKCKKGKAYDDIVDEVDEVLGGSCTKPSIAGSLRFTLSVLMEFNIVEHKNQKYYYIG